MATDSKAKAMNNSSPQVLENLNVQAISMDARVAQKNISSANTPRENVWVGHRNANGWSRGRRGMAVWRLELDILEIMWR